LQTIEPELGVANTPVSDGVASTAELVGDLQIRPRIEFGHSQDETTAKDERLRRGVAARQRDESFASSAVQ
jgi:hypothetical protein